MIRISENDCTRVYSRRGTVAHLAIFGPGEREPVLCRVAPPGWPDQWLGTGSQDEYDKAARMRTCVLCRDALHAHPFGGETP